MAASGSLLRVQLPVHTQVQTDLTFPFLFSFKFLQILFSFLAIVSSGLTLEERISSQCLVDILIEIYNLVYCSLFLAPGFVLLSPLYIKNHYYILGAWRHKDLGIGIVVEITGTKSHFNLSNLGWTFCMYLIWPLLPHSLPSCTWDGSKVNLIWLG